MLEKQEDREEAETIQQNMRTTKNINCSLQKPVQKHIEIKNRKKKAKIQRDLQMNIRCSQ